MNKQYHIMGTCILNWRYKLNPFLSLLCTLSVVSWFVVTDAEAMPSFARQTGEACSVCHTQSFGPNLTLFGRAFKLGGYTLRGGSGVGAELPAVSAMIQGSLTHTNKDQPPPCHVFRLCAGKFW